MEKVSAEKIIQFQVYPEDASREDVSKMAFEIALRRKVETGTMEHPKGWRGKPSHD